MNQNMVERMKVALRPFLHHGLNAYPDVETEAVLAVLTAMNEPTDAMCDAGENTAEGICECMAAREVWPAMIGAVQKELLRP